MSTSTSPSSCTSAASAADSDKRWVGCGGGAVVVARECSILCFVRSCMHGREGKQGGQHLLLPPTCHNMQATTITHRHTHIHTHSVTHRDALHPQRRLAEDQDPVHKTSSIRVLRGARCWHLRMFCVCIFCGGERVCFSLKADTHININTRARACVYTEL